MSSLENFNKIDPFAEGGEENSKSQSGKVHIRIQQRNGRKTLTTVQGIPLDYDLKKILKVLKKDFATNGNIVEDEEMGQIIQFQGDQRVKISEFLQDGLSIKKDKIQIHGF